jgi:hypothetical protein
MFFFEKKNQKTFIRLPGVQQAAKRMKSLFASFSSEKEDSCLILHHPRRPTP